MDASSTPAWPALPWPEGFPPTTPDRIRAGMAKAPADVRAAFDKFERSPVTGTQAANYLGAWLNAAWKSWEKLDATYKVLKEESPSWDWSTVVTTPTFMPLWMPGGSAEDTMDRFFATWRQGIDDLRAQWDRRHPVKVALRERLVAIGTALIDDATRWEVQRMAVWAAELIRLCLASIAEQETQMRELIRAREFDLFGNLRVGFEWIGARLREVLLAVAAAVWEAGRGLVEGLEWPLTVAAVAVGGTVLYAALRR